MYNYNGGWIEVIVGPMFAGKTEELIRRVTRAGIANQEIAIFKPEKDDRYNDNVVKTHNGREIDGYLIGSLYNLFQLSQDYDVIAIDEVQFMPTSQVTKDKSRDDCPIRLVTILTKLANMGIRIITAGLDMDFRGKPFTHMGDLMAVAERVDKLTAICEQCGAPATHTQRLVDGKPAPPNDPLIKTGDKGMYEPRCRECHELKY